MLEIHTTPTKGLLQHVYGFVLAFYGSNFHAQSGRYNSVNLYKDIR